MSCPSYPQQFTCMAPSSDDISKSLPSFNESKTLANGEKQKLNNTMGSFRPYEMINFARGRNYLFLYFLHRHQCPGLLLDKLIKIHVVFFTIKDENWWILKKKWKSGW